MACTGYRLPTEAEWEYAARAGTTSATYAGDLVERHLDCRPNNPTLDPIAWFCGNGRYESFAVRNKRPNPWGLHDMLGNVGEWVWDGYGPYPAGPVTDPTGFDSDQKVLRGFCLGHLARCCRAAHREQITRLLFNKAIGFRLVRTVGP